MRPLYENAILKCESPWAGWLWEATVCNGSVKFGRFAVNFHIRSARFCRPSPSNPRISHLKNAFLEIGLISRTLRVADLITIEPRNKQYNLSFGLFRPLSGQTWPRDPLQRVWLEKWCCRAHLKLAPETNSKAMSWPFHGLYLFCKQRI